MKRVILPLSIIGFIGLVSCGGGGSKEAKELLQRILNLVGIPQSIVVNICQDNNSNGICEASELQAKITINKGDDINRILSKIREGNRDGEYILETFDPKLPLLLELQDIVNVKYDNGKFTLNFNGLNSSELDKELSIFQAMIDINSLTTESVKEARNLNSKEAQDKFYEMLLRVLEKNLTPLRDRLAEPKVTPESSIFSKSTTTDAQQAMRDNLIEMARNLLANGIEKEFPEKLNSCNGDSACIDANINQLAIKLTITPERAREIYPIVETTNTTDRNESNSTTSDNFTIPTGAFITTWKTTVDGISDSNQITIPINSNKSYNYSVDWGDGTHDSNLTTQKTHTYSSEGRYTVTIFGKFPEIAFGRSSDGDISTVENDARKLISISQWGDIKWESMERAFMECTSLEEDATDKPDLSNVKTTAFMFYGATSFNSISISDWDLSNVTDMNSMFAYAYSFNQNIGGWSVSKVTDMSSMFKEAKAFDQDLGSWRVGNVKSMKSMFEGIALSTKNYDNLLIGWSDQILQSSIQFNAGDSIYSCDGKDARDKLLNLWRWIIFDGGTSCSDTHSDLYDDPYTTGP